MFSNTFSLRRYLDGYEGPYHCELDPKDLIYDPFSVEMAETEIAACVALWLKSHNWETYPEVVLRNRSKRPDLIAAKGQWVHVIECKKSLGLPVAEQAMSWLSSHHNPAAGLPHLISVAVQWKSSVRRSGFLLELLQRSGIGLIEVEKRPALRAAYTEESEIIRPCRYYVFVRNEPGIIPGSRHLGKVLHAQLNIDTRIALAGSPGGSGQYMTEWKRTMLRVEELMKSGKLKSTSEIISHLYQTGGYHWCNKGSAFNGINTSLTRLKYQRSEPIKGNIILWKWVEGITKSVIK